MMTIIFLVLMALLSPAEAFEVHPVGAVVLKTNTPGETLLSLCEARQKAGLLPAKMSMHECIKRAAKVQLVADVPDGVADMSLPVGEIFFLPSISQDEIAARAVKAADEKFTAELVNKLNGFEDVVARAQASTRKVETEAAELRAKLAAASGQVRELNLKLHSALNQSDRAAGLETEVRDLKKMVADLRREEGKLAEENSFLQGAAARADDLSEQLKEFITERAMLEKRGRELAGKVVALEKEALEKKASAARSAQRPRCALCSSALVR